MLTYGDGDLAIVPLAKHAYDNGNIEDIPNLIYRKNGQTIRTKRIEISMDNLPRPAYDKEYYPVLDGKIHIVPIEDSRGCSYGRCGFCVHTQIAGKRRVRPIEQLVLQNAVKPYVYTWYSYFVNYRIRYDIINIRFFGHSKHP